ncbi:hypothetical protein LIER_15641 [Lithospermum erythrorhizon]|uniref:Transposase (putative) gypsy type domain-containing protein n=1 Tax=Lithospermum erythrorhizon TaxID=34254 RepID=A0AAV3Q644_LITER
MASLPTFVKNSLPADLTDDQLDGITTYFSIPHDKVDTRLTLRGEQLYLPQIVNDSSDPSLTPVIPRCVEAFTYGMRLPFSHFVNKLLISINRAPGQLAPIGGWLNITIFEVACRMCEVEPTVSLFSALFYVSHSQFQTIFIARRK